MISATSRYASNSVSIVTDDRGTHQSIDPVSNYTGVVNFTYYQVEEYDTIEWIASATYGDGRNWWVIANANPEILDWNDLEVGTILRIPNAQ